jgi:hypothetical protein
MDYIESLKKVDPSEFKEKVQALHACKVFK